MTMEQAEQQGFHFTGITWSIWDKEDEAQQKACIQELKKKYTGVDYRIVTGNKHSWLGSNSKAVMGNDVFQKVQYYNEDQAKKFLNNYNTRVKALKKEYEEKLKKLQEEQDKAQQLYDEIIALKKS